MSDSVINLLIVLIPVSIFIGRIIVNARNKHQQPPNPAQPRIPVHFEDDDSYFKKRASDNAPPAKAAAARVHAARPHAQPTPAKLATLVPNEAFPSAAASSARPSAASGKAAAAPSGQGDFTLNLSHLSPLKQAVVMAEVLGPPKGMA